MCVPTPTCLLGMGVGTRTLLLLCLCSTTSSFWIFFHLKLRWRPRVFLFYIHCNWYSISHWPTFLDIAASGISLTHNTRRWHLWMHSSLYFWLVIVLPLFIPYSTGRLFCVFGLDPSWLYYRLDDTVPYITTDETWFITILLIIHIFFLTPPLTCHLWTALFEILIPTRMPLQMRIPSTWKTSHLSLWTSELSSPSISSSFWTACHTATGGMPGDDYGLYYLPCCDMYPLLVNGYAATVLGGRTAAFCCSPREKGSLHFLGIAVTSTWQAVASLHCSCHPIHTCYLCRLTFVVGTVKTKRRNNNNMPCTIELPLLHFSSYMLTDRTGTVLWCVCATMHRQGHCAGTVTNFDGSVCSITFFCVWGNVWCPSRVIPSLFPGSH